MMNVRGPRPMHRPPGPVQRLPGPPRMQGGPHRPQGPRGGGAPHPMSGPGGHGGGPRGSQSMQQVPGNVTNDPAGAHCRVFVGNLNTVMMKKEDVEQIFGHYGMVLGISMHKGYAFVQYNNPMDARRAVQGEDGKLYAGQTFDINIASEPKNRPTPVATKRPAPPSQQTSRPTIEPARSAVSAPPAKKARPEITVNQSMKRTLVTLGGSNSKTLGASSTAPIVKPSNTVTAVKTTAVAMQDVLICGVCKLQFKSLHSLAQHKKHPCQLRFACKCQNAPSEETSDLKELFCASCDAKFNNAWSLCKHCQEEHSMSIFRDGDQAGSESVKSEVNGDDSA